MGESTSSRCLMYVASPITSQSYINEVRARLSNVFEEYGFKRQFLVMRVEEIPPDIYYCGSLVIVVTSGGTERLILEASRRLPRVNILVVALPYANSLPAVLEAAPLLGTRRATLYLPCIDCDEAKRRLREGLTALKVAEQLTTTRLGIIGGPAPWLVYSWVDPTLVRDALGIEAVHIDLAILYQAYLESDSDDKLLEKVVRSAESVEVPGEDLAKTIRLYKALKRIIAEYKLDAITLKCFDVIEKLGITPCLAMSLLNSEGIVAGCEGDLLSVTAMMILSWVSGGPVFMGNPSMIEGNRIMISHCSAPLAMAGRGYSILSHFETGRPAGIAVYFQEGLKATLLKLRDDVREMRIIVGRIVSGRPERTMQCRSQLWIELPVDPEDLILENSMGNHYVVAYGDHSRGLRILARLLGIRSAIYK
ncbi:MAG: hypothetical protein ABWW69_07100 [Pyrodictiaceae archaeon]